MSTRREILRRIVAPIEQLYGAREARQIALVAVSELTNIRIAELLADPDHMLEIEDVDRIIDELRSGRPLQYVIGAAEFCGLRIGVREGVLIPRPETEELVQWVTNDNHAAARLLDIGTGSGCIALAIKHQQPETDVFATDISEEALAIARTNAVALNLNVEFRRADALCGMEQIFPEQFDVIVSNPPYIPQSERAEIRRNVTGYEPAKALFVPDDDPILFYRAIARAARQILTDGGQLYYEIHEHFGDEVCAMLRAEGFGGVTLRRDFNDKPRMICGRKER